MYCRHIKYMVVVQNTSSHVEMIIAIGVAIRGNCQKFIHETIVTTSSTLYYLLMSTIGIILAYILRICMIFPLSLSIKAIKATILIDLTFYLYVFVCHSLKKVLTNTI